MGIQSFGASMLGDVSQSMERLSGEFNTSAQMARTHYEEKNRNEEIYTNSLVTKKKYGIQNQSKDFLDRLSLSNEFGNYDDSRQQFMDGLRAEIESDTTLNQGAKDTLLNEVLPGLDEELSFKVGYLRDHGQWTQVKVDADQWADVLGSDPTLSKEDAVSQYRYYFETQELAGVPSGYGIKSPEDFERTIEAPKALQAVQNQYKEHGRDPEWDFESSFTVLSDFNLMPYEQEAVKSEALSWYRTKENERKADVLDQTAKIMERSNQIINENGKITHADVAVLTEGLDPKYGQKTITTLNGMADVFADEEALDMLKQYVQKVESEGGSLTPEEIEDYLRGLRGDLTHDLSVEQEEGVPTAQDGGGENLYIRVDSETGTTQDKIEDVPSVKENSNGKYSSSMRSPRGYVTQEDLEGFKQSKAEGRQPAGSSEEGNSSESVKQGPLMLSEAGQEALDGYIKGLETGGLFEPRDTRLAKEFLEANYYNPHITNDDWYKAVSQMVADGFVDGAYVKKMGWWSRSSNITASNAVSTTLSKVNDKVKAFGVKKESQDSVSTEVSKIITRTVTPDMTDEEANAVLERTVAEVASGKVAEDVEDLFKKQLTPSASEIVSKWVSMGTFGLIKPETIENFLFVKDPVFKGNPLVADQEALKLWNSGHLDDYVDDSLFNFLVSADMAKSVTGNPMDMLANQHYGQEYKDLNEAQKTVVASTAFVWKMQDSITETASSTFGFKNSVQVRTPMGFGVLVDDKLYVYDNSGDEGRVGYTSWFINSVSDDVAREISRDMENGNYAMPVLTSSDFTGMPRQISMFKFDEKRFNYNHGGYSAMLIRKSKEIDSLNALDLIYTELDGRKNR